MTSHTNFGFGDLIRAKTGRKFTSGTNEDGYAVVTFSTLRDHFGGGCGITFCPPGDFSKLTKPTGYLELKQMGIPVNGWRPDLLEVVAKAGDWHMVGDRAVFQKAPVTVAKLVSQNTQKDASKTPFQLALESGAVEAFHSGQKIQYKVGSRWLDYTDAGVPRFDSSSIQWRAKPIEPATASWVAITMHKPTIGQRVLITDGNKVKADVWVNRNWRKGVQPCWRRNDPDKFTHWCPLPEVPKLGGK